VAIIGPNGAGKTVLLKALLGCCPTRQGPLVARREIRLRSPENSGRPPDAHSRPRSVGCEGGCSEVASRQRGCCSRHGRFKKGSFEIGIGVISGGQFQKALIAFALLGEPTVLLFDEPRRASMNWRKRKSTR